MRARLSSRTGGRRPGSGRARRPRPCVAAAAATALVPDDEGLPHAPLPHARGDLAGAVDARRAARSCGPGTARASRAAARLRRSRADRRHHGVRIADRDGNDGRSRRPLATGRRRRHRAPARCARRRGRARRDAVADRDGDVPRPGCAASQTAAMRVPFPESSAGSRPGSRSTISTRSRPTATISRMPSRRAALAREHGCGREGAPRLEQEVRVTERAPRRESHPQPVRGAGRHRP